jgi:hypothetical protein
MKLSEDFPPFAHTDSTTGIQDVECMREFKDVSVHPGIGSLSSGSCSASCIGSLANRHDHD